MKRHVGRMSFSLMTEGPLLSISHFLFYLNSVLFRHYISEIAVIMVMLSMPF